MADPKIKISIEVDKPKASKAEKQIKSIGDRIKDLGTKALKSKLAIGAIFAVLSAGALKAIRDFAELDKKMTNVVNLFGGSSDQIREMTGELLDLTSKFPQTAHDMALALFDINSAGVLGAESLSFLAEAAKLATAGATTTENAVTGLISVINAWGVEARNASDIADLFFSAQVQGVTNVERLSKSMGVLIPTAKDMGMSLEEVFASVTTLTKTIPNTERAVTALRGAFMNLASPNEKAQELIKKYNIDMTMSTLTGRGFADVLKDIKLATQGSQDEMKAFFPRMRGYTAATALLRDGTEELARQTEKLTDRQGSANDAYELSVSRLSAQMDILGNNTANFFRKMTEASSPLLTEIVRMANVAIEGLKDPLSRLPYEKIKEDVIRSYSDGKIEKTIRDHKLELKLIEMESMGEQLKAQAKAFSDRKVKLNADLGVLLKIQAENNKKSSNARALADKEEEARLAKILDEKNKKIASQEDANFKLMNDLRLKWLVKREKQIDKANAEEQDAMLENMMNSKADYEEYLTDMQELGSTFVDENGINLEQGLIATTNKVMDGFKAEISKALSSTLGDTASSFISGPIGDLVGLGVTSILTSIFGSKPIKTTAEHAEEAFDKMVKQTNRALDDLGRVKGEQERQADFVASLIDTYGGETTVGALRSREDVSQNIKDIMAVWEPDKTLTQALERSLEEIITTNSQAVADDKKVINEGLKTTKDLLELKGIVSEKEKGVITPKEFNKLLDDTFGLTDEGVKKRQNVLSTLELDWEKNTFGRYRMTIDNLIGELEGGRLALKGTMKEAEERSLTLSARNLQFVEDSLNLTEYNLDKQEEINEKDLKSKEDISKKAIEAEAEYLRNLELTQDIAIQDRIDSVQRLFDSGLLTADDKESARVELLQLKADLRQAKEAETTSTKLTDEQKTEIARLKAIEDTADFLQDERYDLTDLLTDRDRKIRDAEAKYDPINYSTELSGAMSTINQWFADKLADATTDFDRAKIEEPLTININAGAFVGTPEEASNFARLIDEELFKLGRRGEKLS